jgi:hypothetical protein
VTFNVYDFSKDRVVEFCLYCLYFNVLVNKGNYVSSPFLRFNALSRFEIGIWFGTV